jgi:hypothetical protein
MVRARKNKAKETLVESERGINIGNHAIDLSKLWFRQKAISP